MNVAVGIGAVMNCFLRGGVALFGAWMGVVERGLLKWMMVEEW